MLCRRRYRGAVILGEKMKITNQYNLSLFYMIFLLICISCQSKIIDYNNQNGTILEVKKVFSTKSILRKHIQSIYVSDETSPTLLDIYEKPSLSSAKVYQLHYDQTINVVNVLTKEQLFNKNVETWLKISMPHIDGWIFLGNTNPYINNKWEILKRTNNGSKNWTIRKLEQGIAIWNKTNVYENPGLIDCKPIYTIEAINDNNGQINLDTLAITEETDLINGTIDNWALITYKGNIKGWIFCGDATVERGGPKYLTPENIINMYFSVP